MQSERQRLGKEKSETRASQKLAAGVVVAPLMTERTIIMALQLAGFVSVGLMSWLTSLLATEQPLLATTLASAIAAFMAKLLATPIPMVTMAAIEHLPPARVAEVATTALQSLAPDKAAEILVRFTGRPPPL